MIKIVIADDHKLFRDGITSLLASYQDFEVVGSVGSGTELMDILEKGDLPDIVLLDLSMPGMDGFEVLELSKRKHPDLKYIAISMHEEGQYIAKCIRLGAYGYLLKNVDEEELSQAILQVAGGKKYFNRDISDLIIHNMALEGDQFKRLSDRETEVLHYVSEGKTTKEIAEILMVSTRTIETHRMNMMKKLEVQNSAELIKKAVQLKLI